MVSLFKFWSAWFWLHIKVLMFRSNLPPQRRYPMARLHGVETQKTTFSVLIIIIQWRYSPTGLWPTERPPPVSEASANFCG